MSEAFLKSYFRRTVECRRQIGAAIGQLSRSQARLLEGSSDREARRGRPPTMHDNITHIDTRRRDLCALSSVRRDISTTIDCASSESTTRQYRHATTHSPVSEGTDQLVRRVQSLI